MSWSQKEKGKKKKNKGHSLSMNNDRNDFGQLGLN